MFSSKSVMVLNFVYSVFVASNVAFSFVTILLPSIPPFPSHMVSSPFTPSALITFTLPFCKFWKLSFQRSPWISSLRLWRIICKHFPSFLWMVLLMCVLCFSAYVPFFLSFRGQHINPIANSFYVHDSPLNGVVLSAFATKCIVIGLKCWERCDRMTWQSPAGIKMYHLKSCSSTTEFCTGAFLTADLDVRRLEQLTVHPESHGSHKSHESHGSSCVSLLPQIRRLKF